MKNHVIICGLGHVGFRCFELLRQAGVQVAFVANQAPEDWRRQVEEAGGIVVIGDARSDARLREAGVAQAFAILAATDQDLVNVSIMIDARRLNPSIRIVGRMFDTSLGAHVAQAFRVSQIFSTSDLAAPKFVEVISPVSSESVRPGEPTRLLLGDGPDDGDAIAVAVRGQVRSGSEGEAQLRVREVPRRAPPVHGATLRSIRDSLSAPGFSKLRWAASLIATILVGASIVVHDGLSLSWIDSLYFVATTVTTVGYGDINFSGATPGMKAFGVLLMLVGATSLAVLFSAVAEAFLSQRLATLYGGKPVPRSGHVIVVGAGNVGSRIVEHLLEAGVPTVAIENANIGYLAADLKRQIAAVEGDARSSATLNRARVGAAIAVIAATNDDVENLSVALAAQQINPSIESVVRVFDADLGAKLQGKMNLKQIISVPGNAANHFVAAIFADGVKAAIRWQSHLVFLAESPTERIAPVGEWRSPEGKSLALCALPLASR